MKKAPASYLNRKRPPLEVALRLEGGTIIEAVEALERKGYFTPPPRPWRLGFNDLGLGRANCVVLDRLGEVVVEAPNKETAEFIIAAANGHKP